jgi:5-methylcytosine-specific restriction endonuclease McrA
MSKSTPVPHGTHRGYGSGCRCDECKAAERVYRKGRRADLLASGQIPHGTVNGHSNYGCRCEPCCVAGSAKSRAYRQTNAGSLNGRRRAAYAQNPEPARRAMQAYYRRHEANLRSKRRDYYAANREAVIASVMRWATRNPDRANEIKGRRRARKAAGDTRVVTVRDWRRVCARHHNCCAYCGAGGKLTQDHVIPIARGGRHAIGNLLPACGACNFSKGSKLLVEWRALRLAETA